MGKEHAMIMKGAATRSLQDGSNRAEETIGAKLKQLQQSIKVKQKGNVRGKNKGGQNTEVTRIGKKNTGSGTEPSS
jgi:hypothetical protein